MHLPCCVVKFYDFRVPEINISAFYGFCLSICRDSETLLWVCFPSTGLETSFIVVCICVCLPFYLLPEIKRTWMSYLFLISCYSTNLSPPPIPCPLLPGGGGGGLGRRRRPPNARDHPSRPQPSTQLILQSFLLPLSVSFFSPTPTIHILRCESRVEMMKDWLCAHSWTAWGAMGTVFLYLSYLAPTAQGDPEGRTISLLNILFSYHGQ